MSVSACDTALKVSFHPIYRISQFYQLMALIIAVFPLTVIIRKIMKSRFHGNLKWLLCGYFGLFLTFTFVFIVLATIHVANPFFAKTDCDLIINPIQHQIGNFLGCFFMTAPTFFPTSITFERFWATKKARFYEKTRVIGGPIITVFLIILNLFIMSFFVYKDSNVTQGSYSFVIIPDSVSEKMYIFYIAMFVLNSINFCLSFYLIFRNRGLKRINSTLAVKYQLEEVYMSTRFANSVIFVHNIFFGLYIAINTVSKYWGNLLFDDPIELAAVRGAWQTIIATYNLFVGSVAVYFYSKIKRKTMATTISMVRMESTGEVGARNYDKAIFTVWESISV